VDGTDGLATSPVPDDLDRPDGLATPPAPSDVDGLDVPSISPTEAVEERRSERAREFDRVLRNEYDQLLRIARKNAGAHEPAVDIVQEVAYKVFKRWCRRDSDIDNLAAYLTRSVRLMCMNVHRTRRRARSALERLFAEPTPEADPADAAVLRLEEHSAVAKAFARLSDDCQEILDLRVLQVVPVSDVARRLLIAEGTVKSRCTRCLEQLERLLGD